MFEIRITTFLQCLCVCVCVYKHATVCTENEIFLNKDYFRHFECANPSNSYRRRHILFIE